MDTLGIKGGWLTINRVCNIRCEWCYAEGTSFRSEDTMSLSLALRWIEIMAEIGIRQVILIGGEPTLYSHLIETIDAIHAKGMKAVIITNGIRLADRALLDRLIKHRIDGISFSLKAWDPTSQAKLTHSKPDVFEQILQGIRNTVVAGMKAPVSVTISTLNLEHLVGMAEIVMQNGASSVGFSFCATTFDQANPQKGYMVEPAYAIDTLMRIYDQLVQVTNDHFSFEGLLPLCLFPPEFLARIRQDGRASTGCQVLRRNGIITDPEGNLLLCNLLHNFPYGRLDVDFTDAQSLARFWVSSEVQGLYDKFGAMPSTECASCTQYKYCGGGCPMQWFIWDPKILSKIVGGGNECTVPVG